MLSRSVLVASGRTWVESEGAFEMQGVECREELGLDLLVVLVACFYD